MIYVVIAVFDTEEIANVLVTLNKDKAFNCVKENYEGCTELYVETWEDDKFIEDKQTS